MSVLIECTCHTKQSVRNKVCQCGQDLSKLKRSGKARYWINFKVEGKQRREYVGTSIEEARDADGKRRGQRREGRIFDMLPVSDLTMKKAIEAFLNLNTTKKLASYVRVASALKHVSEALGDKLVRGIKTSELDDYCRGRLEKGASKASVTMERTYIKAVVSSAVNDGLLDIRVLQNFKNVKRVMARGENARDRIIGVDEYLSILAVSSAHVAAMTTIAFCCGMRKGEIINLQWKEVDLEKGFFRLPAERTKEKKAKIIPFNRHVYKILKSLPRPIHHDYVIMNAKGNHLTQDGAQKVFVQACKDAQVAYGRNATGGASFHDMRGSWKMNALEAGIDKVYRDVILGHSLTGMDKHYVEKRLSSREDLLKAAMDRYTEWLDGEIVKVQQGQVQDQKLTKGLTK